MLTKGGAESTGRRSRSRGGRRRRRRGGTRGENATGDEGAQGRTRQHRLTTRDTNPSSSKAERHCGGRITRGGGSPQMGKTTAARAKT